MRWARDVPCVQRPFVLAKIHISLIQTKLEYATASWPNKCFIYVNVEIKHDLTLNNDIAQN